MTFESQKGIEGVSVNVSWDAQGVQMNYTVNMRIMNCRMPDDMNNAVEISLSTELDNIIMPGLGV